MSHEASNGSHTPAKSYYENWGENTNGQSYSNDKLKLGYITSDQHYYDKDVNNYNFATIEEFLSPLFNANSTGAGSGIKQLLLDLVYPIGSVFTSTKNISPADRLGGTWRQLEGQFLRAATSSSSIPSDSSTYKNTNGGHAEAWRHTHTTSQASHKHDISTSTDYIDDHKHYPENLSQYFLTVDSFSNFYATDLTGYPSSAVQVRYLISRDTYKPNVEELEATSEAGGHSHNLSGDTNYAEVDISIDEAGSVNNTDSEETANLPPYLNVYMWVRTA